jgi:tRNA A37 threonylcarbamoyladenosine biosynthesis protein TsaE
LKGIEEFRDLAIDEALESGAVVFVEWSDRVEPALPIDRIDARLDDLGVERRRIALEGLGPRSQRILADW